MKNTRKISLLLVAAIVFSLFTTVANAESGLLKKVKSYNSVVNIKGELDESYAGQRISVMLLDKTANINAVTSADIKYINQLTVPSNGAYNLSFKLASGVNAGDCKVYAKVGKENVTSSVVSAVSNVEETVDYELGLTVDVASATATVAIEDDFGIVGSGDIEYIPIIAFYDANGKLISTVKGTKNVPSVRALIPQNTQKTKAFLWKSVNTLIPLASSEEKIGKKDNLNILIIGNSFSVDGTHYLKNLADAAGVSINKVAVIQHGGSRLSSVWDYRVADQNGNPYFSYQCTGQSGVGGVTLDYAFTRGIQWDYVLLQEWRPDAGTYEQSWQPYIFKLAEYVKERCPNAQLGFQMTWAFELGKPMNGYYDGTLNDDPSIQGIGQKQMWANSYSFNRRAASELGAYAYNEAGDTISFGGYPVMIVPSGYAVQYAKSLEIGGIKKFDTIRSAAKYEAAVDALIASNPSKLVVNAEDLLADEDAGKIRLHRDGFHMSQAGRYLIACVWLEQITGVSAVGNSFIPGALDLDSDIGNKKDSSGNNMLSGTQWVHYSGLDAETCALLQQVAHEAVTKYNNGDIIE